MKQKGTADSPHADSPNLQYNHQTLGLFHFEQHKGERYDRNHTHESQASKGLNGLWLIILFGVSLPPIPSAYMYLNEEKIGEQQ